MASMAKFAQLKGRVRESFQACDTVVCPVTTLGAIIKQHGLKRIDLLKIDTQGHELRVIRGARHLLSRHVQTRYACAYAHVHACICT